MRIVDRWSSRCRGVELGFFLPCCGLAEAIGNGKKPVFWLAHSRDTYHQSTIGLRGGVLADQNPELRSHTVGRQTMSKNCVTMEVNMEPICIDHTLGP